VPRNSAFDSLEFDRLDFPYNRILNELDGTPRLIRGSNTYVTMGGKMCKRPGLIGMPNGETTGLRCDRLWSVETNENPAKLYLVASMFNTATGFWELHYQRMNPPTFGTWTLLPNYRDSNLSTDPHEAVVARGFLYIKGFPEDSSTEKLGSVVFDGSGASTPRLRPWGLLPPTQPARIKGAVNRTDGAIDATTTTLNVSVDATTAGFPTAPFVIQVDFEQMQVTSTGSGTNWTVVRGHNGTIPAGHANDTVVIWRNWTASAHRIDVNLTWQYAYCWKTADGHYSNRSAPETNPDLPPSATGPFFDLCPEIIVRGSADPNITDIVIMRTTDGGGTFFILEEIANPGDSDVTYRDDSLESGASGGVFDDPLPDTSLDQATLSPTLTSNSPPPSTVAPNVVGVDPVERSTPMEYYAGRIWYAIGNILFYSSQEELPAGIPEEAFPSGLRGNFYKLQYPITNLAATSDALIVTTVKSAYYITGQNRETFNLRILYEEFGHPIGHPRAICRFENRVALLTHDFRVAVITSPERPPDTISDPLFTDIVDASSALAEFDIKYWADLEKQWLVIAAHRQGNPTQSRQWVYDLKKAAEAKAHFWFTPWTVPATAMASTRISELSGQRRLVFFTYDPASTDGRFSRLDPTGRVSADDTWAGDGQPYSTVFVTNLFTIPAGNHVNLLRKPELTPCVYSFRAERTVIGSEDDPQLFFFLDDLWTDPITPFPMEDVSRRPPSKGYKSMVWPVNQVGYRVALQMQIANSVDPMEIQSLVIVWNPEAGA
jgi:hypothetical protein